ncbi:hypothetical protein CUS_5678 [Ruminococcus albus 8]|uniref:Uncharacterized protein n=1 Tax=Ruminococcus albus 8 TaxID=246199 RepID=E9SF22_RUMAL|nr:hypothetical protein CUS_5678 [Ruminococcus albus 8]
MTGGHKKSGMPPEQNSAHCKTPLRCCENAPQTLENYRPCFKYDAPPPPAIAVIYTRSMSAHRCVRDGFRFGLRLMDDNDNTFSAP